MPNDPMAQAYDAPVLSGNCSMEMAMANAPSYDVSKDSMSEDMADTNQKPTCAYWYVVI